MHDLVFVKPEWTECPECRLPYAGRSVCPREHVAPKRFGAAREALVAFADGKSP